VAGPVVVSPDAVSHREVVGVEGVSVAASR